MSTMLMKTVANILHSFFPFPHDSSEYFLIRNRKSNEEVNEQIRLIPVRKKKNGI
jgi:hypothetical protein